MRVQVKDARTGKWVKVHNMVGYGTKIGKDVSILAVRSRKNPDKEPREVQFTITRSDFDKLVDIMPTQFCGEPFA
jgi:hypothetical protein